MITCTKERTFMQIVEIKAYWDIRKYSRQRAAADQAIKKAEGQLNTIRWIKNEKNKIWLKENE